MSDDPSCGCPGICSLPFPFTVWLSTGSSGVAGVTAMGEVGVVSSSLMARLIVSCGRGNGVKGRGDGLTGFARTGFSPGLTLCLSAGVGVTRVRLDSAPTLKYLLGHG